LVGGVDKLSARIVSRSARDGALRLDLFRRRDVDGAGVGRSGDHHRRQDCAAAAVSGPLGAEISGKAE
jgi:hypothetical protein